MLSKFSMMPLYHRESCRNVRVGIALGGHPMGGPARMGDTDVGAQRALVGQRGEFGHRPAERSQVHFAIMEHGQPGRIIATVFELAQPSRRTGTILRVAIAVTMPHM